MRWTRWRCAGWCDTACCGASHRASRPTPAARVEASGTETSGHHWPVSAHLSAQDSAVSKPESGQFTTARRTAGSTHWRPLAPQRDRKSTCQRVTIAIEGACCEQILLKGLYSRLIGHSDWHSNECANRQRVVHRGVHTPTRHSHSTGSDGIATSATTAATAPVPSVECKLSRESRIRVTHRRSKKAEGGQIIKWRPSI